MRHLKFALLLVSVTSFILGSCVTTHPSGNPHGMPPGQQKKIYGTQSAKPFAPGQQKKRGGY
ncbi:quinol oxidase subunit 4 [Chitinophaga solisilvae]|uniref:quinol oxidase subunit 4 n=1 Tax=Chitinophaga solisilvae TaxID=1233460 RepID=UPI00136D8B79|nr:quinol oxidase subunit 4 [Chitinophaga solisilvae]